MWISHVWVNWVVEALEGKLSSNAVNAPMVGGPGERVYKRCVG